VTAGAKLHWPEYAIEAALLAAFMLVACVLGVVLGHPASAAVRAIPDPFARRALFGLAMGTAAICIVYSPAGRRSGAHLNPALTLAYLRLGKLRPMDAAFYAGAQVAGAIAGVLLARALLGDRLAHPEVHFVTTRPGAAGLAVAFAAEAAIAFVLLSVVLAVSSSRRARWTGACAGALVFLFVTFEAPLSGTSMNPARSLASALAAGELASLWIYLVAPPLGMLAAAAWMRGKATRACAKLDHAPDVPCIFCGQGLGGAAPPAAGGEGRGVRATAARR
jgi:aquaporin Z